MWLIRIPPRSAALIVGPINDVAVGVLATHFIQIHRLPDGVETLRGASDRMSPPAGVGVIIVTEPWPAMLSPVRVEWLGEMVRLLQPDGCLLLLTDEAIAETDAGVRSDTALRSVGFSRVQRYLVEPSHSTPRSIVPLVPSAIAHSPTASGGRIKAPLRSVRDRVLGTAAPRCLGQVAYR